MKKKITALAVAVMSMTGAGSVSAYSVDYGYDANGSNTLKLTSSGDLANSLGAQSTFLARFSGGIATVEDLELVTPGAGPKTLTFGSGSRAVSATLAGASGEVIASSDSIFGRYSAPGGSRFWSASAPTTGPDTFKVTFDSKVEGFGFFGIDVGDFGGALDIDLLDDTGAVIGSRTVVGSVTCTTIDCPEKDARNGSVLYFGIKAEGEAEWFRGIRFNMSSPTTPDGFAFDSFTVVGADRGTSTGVPEPGSLVLASLALFGLAAARRRS